MAMDRDYFQADISRRIWDTKYRFRERDEIRDQTIEDSWRRVARALASVEKSGQAEWERRFYHVLEGFKFLPGGRIQAGAGTGHRVTLFNCFVMGTIEDSLDAIFDALKEGALTMQQGGGVGYDFSTLRPGGAPAMSVGVTASGPVSFMQIWDAMCATILSTGARRGAMMATLRCDHPDIEEFIRIKQDATKLRHFNLSVLVSDAFMQAVHADADWPLVFPLAARDIAPAEKTVERVWSGSTTPVRCRVLRTLRARQLWDQIMQATYEYAEPGAIFVDRVNALNNLWYAEQISATNPCVTADTWICTRQGPRQVRELCGFGFEALINGKAYTSTPQGFFSTGRKATLRLTTREGHSLCLTTDHPVLRVTRLTRWTQEFRWTVAGQLKAGDKIAIHNHRGGEGWPGSHGESEGYLLGLLVGDGTFGDGQAQLRVWPEQMAVNSPAGESGVSAVMRKVELIVASLPHRRDFSGWRLGGAGTYRFLKLSYLTRLAASLGICRGNKTVTPEIERCSSEFYRGFLRGLFDTDGSIQGTQDKGVSIRLAQSDVVMLQAVQRMLLRLGIASTLYCERRVAGLRLLPDGHGGRRAYDCRADHELVISDDNLRVYSDLVGFTDSQKQARLQSTLSGYKRDLNRERFVVTVDGTYPESEEEVFDVQIPGVNAFDANGLVVHNCGEIPLPPYGACDLGSINLTQFVRAPFGDKAALDLQGIADTAAVAVRMLDNVADLSRFPLARQAEVARATRRLGLGLTGLGDALIMLGIPYGTPEAARVAGEVMQRVCETAYHTSIELAREKGAFARLDKNKHLQGKFIGHLPADIRAGIARHGIRNSHLTAIAPTGTISLLANNVSSGLEPVYRFEYRRRVREADGSLSEHAVSDYAYRLYRTLRGADAPLTPAFVTAGEVSPFMHLDMQAALQPWVDNAISKTINVPPDYSFAQFRSLYDYAYAKGLKGCTTFRPNPVTGQVLVDLDVADAQNEKFSAIHCCSAEREAD
jgi:ribonucleoside-diphosphate reductase alpha chain